MLGRSRTFLRLIGLFTMLLPAVLIGGGAQNQASAEARVGAQAQTTMPDPSTVLVMKVYFTSNAQRDQLATELAAEEMSTTGGYLVVIKDRATYDNLVARGLRVEIDQALTDKFSHIQDFYNPDTFYGGYKTVDEIYGWMDAKVTQFGGLVEKIDIGDSWCKTHAGQCTQPNSWNGFDLYVLHITNRSIGGNKPVFWYDAGIHSREIATPEVAMRFVDYLLFNYDTDADAHWLVDYQDIWVMPTLNPDGHHMNESGGSGTPTLHRKNADKDDGCTTYDSFGTDINRNFPFVWGCCGGSSGSPCNETYRGPAANSEDETQAVVAKIASLIPDQRGPNESDLAPITTTGTLINMHSNAQQNLYPWGYTTSYAPNRTDLRNIGRHMNSQQVSPPGNGYEYCQNVECLYIVDGDEKNWSYGVLGIPSYSLELSGNDFFPEYACLDAGGPPCTSSVGPGIWPQNKGALLYHSKIARAPYLLTRGPDTNANSGTAISVVQGSSATLTSTINYNWSGTDGQPNAYLQNVAAAEYYVDTPPWAGGTAVAMNAVDGAFDEQTEPVTASVPTGSLSVGRHVLFMRGRGVNDYEGYQSWGTITAVFLDVTSSGGPTSTPTNTSVVPTATRTNTQAPTSTNTAVVPTNTGTAVAPTATSTGTAVAPTFTSTGTAVVPTSTATGTTVPATETPGTPGTPSVTPTACTIEFADVLPGNTFYATIHCLACQGIINGYPCGGDGEPCNGTNDPYFRPSNNITRGQLAKVVSQSAGYTDPVTTQAFEDVAPGTTFYDYVGRLAIHDVMGGYPCGVDPNEPCGSGNLPYFRPGANATRGQLTKIVSNAAGFSDPDPSTFTFTDVPPGSTFHLYVERLLINRPGAMSGYPCSAPAEPCDDQNRPYFRPSATLSRGQTSKIVTNTFFPDCALRK